MLKFARNLLKVFAGELPVSQISMYMSIRVSNVFQFAYSLVGTDSINKVNFEASINKKFESEDALNRPSKSLAEVSAYFSLQAKN